MPKAAPEQIHSDRAIRSRHHSRQHSCPHSSQHRLYIEGHIDNDIDNDIADNKVLATVYRPPPDSPANTQQSKNNSP